MENNIADSEIRIFTIHSQKGGVGKTSIVMAIAGWAYFQKMQKTLIIDCDLTGTSIVDLFYANKSSQKDENSVLYLNDLLLASPLKFGQYEKEFPEERFCLRINDYDHVRYIPSSPVLADIRKVVGLISQEDKLHYFQSRMEDVLKLFVERGINNFIIDNPPGLFGLSRAMINLEISNNYRCTRKTIFVTTPDPMDYRSLVPAFSEYWVEMKKNKQKDCMDNFYFLVNKVLSEQYRDPVFCWEAIFKDLDRPNPFPDSRIIMC